MKLSAKQKEVIQKMRVKAGVFRWIGMPYCKYTFEGKTFRYGKGNDLLVKKLITGATHDANGTYFELTPLGKTITL